MTTTDTTAPSASGDARRALIAILAVSTCLKLILLIPAHYTSPVRDAWDYFRTARAVHDRGEYVTQRAPLYPLALTGALWIASLRGDDALSPLSHDPNVAPVGPPRSAPSDLDIARVLQVAFSGVTVWLLYLIGAELFDRRAGLFAAALAAFYPDYIGYTHILWAETQLIMLNLGWILMLLRGLREDRIGLLCWAGVLFGMAALTRQVVLSAAALIVPWMFLVARQAAGRTARLAAVMMFTGMLVIAPWTVRNAYVYRAFVPVSPQSGLFLLWGASTNLYKELRNAGVSPFVQGVMRDRLARARALQIIRDDPKAYAHRLVNVNLTGLWAPGSIVLEYVVNQSYGYGGLSPGFVRTLIAIFVVTDVLVIVLGIIGAALAPAWRHTTLFAGMAAHATLLHAIGAGFHRHRLYLSAFSILYTGFLLSRRGGELRTLATRWRVAIALCVLGLFAWVLANGNHDVLISWWEKTRFGKAR